MRWRRSTPFIVVTTITVLNLFIALIANSIQSLQARMDETLRTEAGIAHDEREQLSERIRALTGEVRKMRDLLGER